MMNLVQFGHGILVEAENFARHVTEALPSFNPLPEELHDNPVAVEGGNAEWTPPIDAPVKDEEKAAAPVADSKPADEFLKDEAKKD